jgi:serine-type D-Ala-D-Ala carboxypeptidase (penicillin-binding protein 5/6)
MWSLFRPYQVLIVSAVLLVMAASSLLASTDKPIEVMYVPETFVVADTVPTLPVTSYLIFDVATGQVIASQDSDIVAPMASVTKLLTAATVLRTVALDDEYTVTAADTDAHGRAGRLTPGEKYTARELLFPLLLESSNDAAAVFERETEGDIVRRMNGYASELGASTVVVVDASGLSSENRASARDLAHLTSTLYRLEPHLFDIARLSKQAGAYTGWTNNSPVFSPEYRGGKHGFTEAANRTLVALFEESFPVGSRVLGYVVLGSDDLARDTAELRDFVASEVTLQ